jgi:hypothetical protein
VVSRREIELREPVSAETLRKIWRGALVSPFLKGRHRERISRLVADDLDHDEATD